MADFYVPLATNLIGAMDSIRSSWFGEHGGKV
jgi:hypothetical protein